MEPNELAPDEAGVYGCPKGHVHVVLPVSAVLVDGTIVRFEFGTSEAIEFANALYTTVREIHGGGN